MTVLRVEIDGCREDQTIGHSGHLLHQAVHSVVIALGVNAQTDATPGEKVLNLADGDDRTACRRQAVEQRLSEWRPGGVMPVSGLFERTGLADEWPGDDPADTQTFRSEAIGDLACPIKLRDRNDRLVRAHLEDAVVRGVDAPGSPPHGV